MLFPCPHCPSWTNQTGFGARTWYVCGFISAGMCVSFSWTSSWHTPVAVYHLCVKRNRMGPSLITALLGGDKHMGDCVSLFSYGHRHQTETHTAWDEHMLMPRFPTFPPTSLKSGAIIVMAASSAVKR